MYSTFLGKTFLGNAVSYLYLIGICFPAAPAGLDKRQSIGYRKIFCTLVCDGFLEKIASSVLSFPTRSSPTVKQQALLMRAWLAGVMLAIFGLWLALI